MHLAGVRIFSIAGTYRAWQFVAKRDTARADRQQNIGYV